MPLLASSQGGLLFPPNWFYLFFSAPTATNLMVVSSYMIAALVALQAFVGHQQTLAYSLLLVAVYAVASAFAEKKTRTRYLWSLALMGAGVLLAAVQILPTFELLRNSPRADATYDFFTSFSMPRGMTETFLAPYIFGGGDGRLFRAPYVGPPFYGELAGYVGVLGVMLALV